MTLIILNYIKLNSINYITLPPCADFDTSEMWNGQFRPSRHKYHQSAAGIATR